MPVNRNALIRYRTIDNCLRNKYRQWTLDDLIAACSDALYEYEGIDKGISRRSIQQDLQMMRSEKLGYNAPIVVIDKKYYTYEDPNYSITNIPLTDQDLSKLTEIVDLLRQFKGFTHFQDLNGMVQRLEDRIHTAKTKQPPIIDLEKNEGLKGLEFLDALYQAILKKKAVSLTYQSFKAREADTFIFHPYLLKEYRNRWFVLGTKKRNQPVLNLALDRIRAVAESTESYLENTSLNLAQYYEHVVGVTINQGEPPEDVVLFVKGESAPYILTKPIHHSQQLIEQTSNGIKIGLKVQLNFELEREILGFGDCIKVLKPARLKRRIYDLARHTAELYGRELQPGTVESSLMKVKRNGAAILENIYTNKEVSRVLSIIARASKAQQHCRRPENLFAIPDLLQEIPDLKAALFNHNLCTLVKEGFGKDYFLTKAIYFDKPLQSEGEVTWHQDVSIQVKEKIETEGFHGWANQAGVMKVVPPLEYLQSAYTLRIHLDDTDEKNGALKVIPQTHFNILTPEEMARLGETEVARCCKILKGSVHVLKPLAVHATAKPENGKPGRVIQLEFNCRELPGGLEWLEKDNLTGTF